MISGQGKDPRPFLTVLLIRSFADACGKLSGVKSQPAVMAYEGYGCGLFT